MAQHRMYRYQTKSIAVGDSQVFAAGGDWFHLFNATKPVGLVLDDGTQVWVSNRTTIRWTFQQVKIVNLSGADALSAVFYIGDGEPPDMGMASDNVHVQQDVPDVSCGAAAATQLFTDNATIRATWLSIPAGEANGLRIGNSTAGAARGIYLGVGGAPFLWRSPRACYAYNAGAGAVKMALLKETF